MATPTHIPLATITLSSASASVTFSNISQDFGDLIVSVNAGSTNSNGMAVDLTFNGDTTTSNYSYVVILGNGTTASSGINSSDAQIAQAGDTAKSTTLINVMDYSATDKHKISVSRTGLFRSAASTLTMAYAHKYASNSAITSLTLQDLGGASFDSGSTFTLYGVAK